MNKIILIGKIRTVPEIRKNTNDKEYYFFELQTTDRVTDKEFASYHKINIYGKMKETVEELALNVGDTLVVEGKIQYSKQVFDGYTKYMTQIIAERIEQIENNVDNDPIPA